MTIGVDLGGTNIRAGIIAKGSIIVQRHTSLKNKDSLPESLTQFIEFIAPLIQPDIKGIGIGVPSVVDIDKGIVYNVVKIPSWEKVELKDILQKEFKIPVYVNNDVNCFVLGEHQYGLAKPFKSVVGLTIGTGLGSGIIINNQLYSGNNCGAGEIGYLPYRDENFEYYCSSSFFESKHNTTALKAYQDASDGNSEAFNIWNEFGLHIGNAVKAVVYTYDPEAIILGGSIAKAYEFFAGEMRKALVDCYFPESIKRLKILQSKNENITLLGAAALVH
ncbi:MAG: ROK family protein [Bacteroidetes bacterium]|nr:ROK family protein [Bacteroidota bacterium]